MKRKAAESQLVRLTIATRDGEFTAAYSVKGLAALLFPAKRRGDTASPKALPVTIRRWHRATGIALKRALAGRTTRISPPLDLSEGTAFQQRVWDGLQKIPRGETRSYGELARLLKNARAARAVGSACRANPIPILIPCHRVLAAKHKLGGYSGGLEWKRKLLWREESRNLWKG